MPMVTLSQEATINGEIHEEGKTLSVSKSIYDRLKAEGKIEEPKAPSSRKREV